VGASTAASSSASEGPTISSPVAAGARAKLRHALNGVTAAAATAALPAHVQLWNVIMNCVNGDSAPSGPVGKTRFMPATKTRMLLRADVDVDAVRQAVLSFSALSAANTLTVAGAVAGASSLASVASAMLNEHRRGGAAASIALASYDYSLVSADRVLLMMSARANMTMLLYQLRDYGQAADEAQAASVTVQSAVQHRTVASARGNVQPDADQLIDRTHQAVMFLGMCNSRPLSACILNVKLLLSLQLVASAC